MEKSRLTNLILTVLFCCLTFIASGIPEAVADYYKYKNKQGTICFTNDLKTIPEQYVKNAVLVGKDAPPPAPPAARQSPLPSAEPAIASQTEKVGTTAKAGILSDRPKLKAALMVTALLAGFLLLYAGIGWITAYLDCRQIGTIIRIVFTVGIVVYGSTLYSGKLFKLYNEITRKVTVIKKDTDKKTKSINEGLK